MRQQTIKVGPARLPIKIRAIGAEKVVFTWSWPAPTWLNESAVPFDRRDDSSACSTITIVAIEFLRHKWFNAIIRDLQDGPEFSYFALSSQGRITVPRASAPQMKAMLRTVLNWPESWRSYEAVSIGGVSLNLKTGERSTSPQE